MKDYFKSKYSFPNGPALFTLFVKKYYLKQAWCALVDLFLLKSQILSELKQRMKTFTITW